MPNSKAYTSPKKITLVSRNFPPLTGGMERLVYHVFFSLINDYSCTLVGPEGCSRHIPPDQPVIENRITPTPLFLLSCLLKAIRFHLKKERPDVVLGGSGLVAPVVYVIAKLFGAKVVIFIHGLDLIARSRIYQALFIPFIKRCDLLICNSQSTARLAIEKGVSQTHLSIVHPGVELPDSVLPQHRAKSKLGKENKHLLISVGRLIPRKGLPEFIENVLPELIEGDENIELVIIGEEPGLALNNSRESTLDRIRHAIQIKHMEKHVSLLGRVSDAELEYWYAAADVLVFPLKETPGDVEGFGMVAVEAAARGTPTVAFDCGGVADAIQEGVSGHIVEPGNYPAFRDAIKKVLGRNMRKEARAFASQFSWAQYTKKLINLIEQI